MRLGSSRLKRATSCFLAFMTFCPCKYIPVFWFLVQVWGYGRAKKCKYGRHRSSSTYPPVLYSIYTALCATQIMLPNRVEPPRQKFKSVLGANSNIPNVYWGAIGSQQLRHHHRMVALPPSNTICVDEPRSFRSVTQHACICRPQSHAPMHGSHTIAW